MGIFISPRTERFKQQIKIVGVMLLAAAAYFSVVKIQFTQPNFIKEGTVPFSDMNKTDVYEITDIIVFDNYAVYTDKSSEYKYFTVLAEDSDGYSKYASLVINADDAIYNKVMAFNDDFSLSYGECVLNGGFTAVKMDDVKMNSDDAAELKNMFNKDISNCQQFRNADASDVILTYACASEADFAEYKEDFRNESIMWYAITASFAVIGIIFIALGVIMTKRDKKKALASAEENVQYYNPDYNNSFE